MNAELGLPAAIAVFGLSLASGVVVILSLLWQRRRKAPRATRTGSEGIRLYYEEFLRACADLRVEVHAEHVCTETIILEVTISGTHTGSWHGLPATARRFQIPLCGIYTFDSADQMAGERIYYDRATVFAQLGVFREPVGWFGRAALALNHPLTIGRSIVRMLWK
jgi:predicted ester cyclase